MCCNFRPEIQYKFTIQHNNTKFYYQVVSQRKTVCITKLCNCAKLQIARVPKNVHLLFSNNSVRN